MNTFQPNAAQQLHINVMRDVARSMNDLPMVLKGGTALLLGYELNRFSEDIDFDSPKKFSLTGRIKNVFLKHGYIPYDHTPKITIPKDTTTVQKIHAYYIDPERKEINLKIETSFRIPPVISNTIMIDGIRMFNLETLISQKVHTLKMRTTARDLYDIAFLANKHWNKFSDRDKKFLNGIMKNINDVEKRFVPAFKVDKILKNTDVTELIINISEKLGNPLKNAHTRGRT